MTTDARLQIRTLVYFYFTTALQRSRRMWSTEYHSQSTTPPLMLTCEYIFAHAVTLSEHQKEPASQSVCTSATDKVGILTLGGKLNTHINQR